MSESRSPLVLSSGGSDDWAGGRTFRLTFQGAVHRVLAVARQPGDPRHEREAGLGRGEVVVGLADQRARLLVHGLYEPPWRVVRPARRVRLTRDAVDEQDLPGAVVTAPRVPLHGLLVGAAQQQPLLHRLAELGPGGLAGPTDRGLTRPLRHEGALREHGALEAADAIDGDAGELGDLFGGGACAYTRLDVSGAEMALHLDLDLAEAGTVAANGGAQTLVDRKRVLRRVGSLQHQPCAVI